MTEELSIQIEQQCNTV